MKGGKIDLSGLRELRELGRAPEGRFMNANIVDVLKLDDFEFKDFFTALFHQACEQHRPLTERIFAQVSSSRWARICKPPLAPHALRPVDFALVCPSGDQKIQFAGVTIVGAVWLRFRDALGCFFPLMNPMASARRGCVSEFGSRFVPRMAS